MTSTRTLIGTLILTIAALTSCTSHHSPRVENINGVTYTHLVTGDAVPSCGMVIWDDTHSEQDLGDC